MQKVVVGLVSRQRGILGEEYLFIEYKKFPGLHGLCGGHIDPGEDEKTTLIREFKEELGIKVTPLDVKHVMDSDVVGELIEIWDCNIESFDFVIQQEEIVAAKWFLPEEVVNNPKLFFPAIYNYFKEEFSGRN